MTGMRPKKYVLGKKNVGHTSIYGKKVLHLPLQLC